MSRWMDMESNKGCLLIDMAAIWQIKKYISYSYGWNIDFSWVKFFVVLLNVFPFQLSYKQIYIGIITQNLNLKINLCRLEQQCSSRSWNLAIFQGLYHLICLWIVKYKVLRTQSVMHVDNFSTSAFVLIEWDRPLSYSLILRKEEIHGI